MNKVFEQINEIGAEIKNQYEVVIRELVIDGNTATFQAGENDNHFVMEFEQRDADDGDGPYIEVDVKNLTILVDFGVEKYVPMDVSLNENHLFVVTAIEKLIGAELYSQRLKSAEVDSWESLIDHNQASKS